MEMASHRYADTLVLTLHGRLDHETADGFRHDLIPHLDQCTGDGDRLVLDLSGVDYISIVGLRVLMMASKQVKAQGGIIVVAAMQPVVREIFDIAHFNLVLETFASVADALAKVSPAAAAEQAARGG